MFTSQTCGSSAGGSGGLLACGNIGATGVGTTHGVDGHTSGGGIAGVVGQGPTGVFGLTFSTTVGSAVVGQGAAFGVSGQGLTGVSGKGGDGVYGEGTENGVHANGGTFGLFAEGDDYGVYGSAPNHGVFGQATSSSGAGVEAAGTGGGTALRVTGLSQFTGKTKFSRSGIATVPSGTKKIKVTMSGVSTSSMVLATVQQSGGFFVQYAVPASGSFTIFINKAPVSPNVVKVAYFVLN